MRTRSLPRCLTLVASLATLATLATGCGATPTTAGADAAVPTDRAQTDASAANDAPADAGAADAAGPERAEQRLFRYLLGRFDSSAQSFSDPTYYAIRVEACRVAAPTLGAQVLYLEQARAGMAPYRQRLYVVDADGTPGAVVSRVFELNTPARYVGACAAAERPTFTADDVIERAGCAVHLQARGETFEGGTVGHDCESTINGAVYATSEVVFRSNGFASWDRGFTAADRQVWGATAGPYQFVRRTPIEAAVGSAGQ